MKNNILLKCVYYNFKYAIKYFLCKLKRKSNKNKKKFNIVFLVARANVWNSVKSVYEAALNSDDINVYLVALPPYKNKKLDLESDVNYDFLSEFNSDVIRAYNKETKEYFDINKLSPDYIIYSIPYSVEYPKQYNFKNMAKICELCYISYGFTLVRSEMQKITVQPDVMKYVSYIFTCNDIIYNHYRKNMILSEFVSGKRLYNIGFPRFDLYKDIKSVINKPETTIMWLPRWTTQFNFEIQGNEPSSFFVFKDKILEYASNNDDINLLIRPHPLAFYNYIKSGIMTSEEVESYKDSLNKLSNIQLDTKPSYYENLINTDILITDFTSIVIEFFITGKPIIYFGSNKNYPPEYLEIYDSFYHAETWDEVEEILSNLRAGMDEKQVIRNKAIENFMKDKTYNVGEKIINILTNNR